VLSALIVVACGLWRCLTTRIRLGQLLVLRLCGYVTHTVGRTKPPLLRAASRRHPTENSNIKSCLDICYSLLLLLPLGITDLVSLPHHGTQGGLLPGSFKAIHSPNGSRPDVDAFVRSQNLMVPLFVASSRRCAFWYVFFFKWLSPGTHCIGQFHNHRRD
jgi:hypothetical protein